MRICIIGAGPAGISAAHYLAQKGYTDVTILEKNDYIGGKCRTLQVDGRAYDMGAVQITPEYRIVNEFIKRFGLEDTIEPTPPLAAINRAGSGICAGERFDLCLYPELRSDPGILGPQFTNFFEARARLADYLDQSGFAGMPDELKVPFSDWLDSIGAPLLNRTFWIPITNYGYGFLNEIPAVYVLKFNTVQVMNALMEKQNLGQYIPEEYRTDSDLAVYRLRDGFQNLMQLIADSLPNTFKVVLNAEVLSARRDIRDIVFVRYRTPEGLHECPARGVFVMVGAAPNTNWLPSCVKLDPRGYVITGEEVGGRSQFETSHHGIYAVGDVRAGSVKRVASAVGEGSVVISDVWSHVRGDVGD